LILTPFAWFPIPVELELGLLDEAAEKFERVLHDHDALTRYNAAYGLASAMLVFARQATGEGKYGGALSCLKKGIKALMSFVDDADDTDFYCVWKLLGDLYSHGSIIPPSVFEETLNSDGNKEKLEFIAKGEDAYNQITASVDKIDDPERKDGLSSIWTTASNDLGINLLLQARIHSECLHEDSGIGSCTSYLGVAKDDETQILLDLAVYHFVASIESDPLLPMSWCGLGSALVSREPILAQHAFCRALQLDKGMEDAWSNLSLLYFDHDKVASSEETVDSLTQVADSAIMWIARGLLIEKTSKGTQDAESVISKASDAYRASLQISRHQAALLGLSLTCRRLGIGSNLACDDYVKEASNIATKESHANLEMFLNSSAGRNIGARALSGIMTCEKGFGLQRGNRSTDLGLAFLDSGRKMLTRTKEQLADLPNARGTLHDDARQTAVALTNLDLNSSKLSPCITAEEIDHTVVSCASIVDNILYELASDGSAICANELQSIQTARTNVIHSPDSGLMWLNLSKSLLKALQPDSSGESYRSVKAAIERTKKIMVSDGTGASLLHPSSKSVSNVQRSVSSRPVMSSKLSEAFALSDWVQDLSPEEKEDTYDLQRAVLLDPENYFARSKLME